MEVTGKIDLSGEIRDWKEAELGEEVRGANVRAFEKIQAEVNAAIDNVNDASKNVEKAAVDVAKVAKDAADTVVRANQTIDHADEILADATAQAATSADSAEMSESWAVGGTGTRTGENTNNSEYYSRQSKTSAEDAKNEADRAALYSKIIAPGFYFEPETGSLYMKAGVGVSFVVEDSRIYWKIA